ncbi:chemotaxis protein CheW [Vibrio genomosp. F10 str. 9ZC157]|uniref:Chemotaxis protein CheW n=1 Tax=Vibrio genomosp. F10 str. ZF-129 TaxID=1187848 RepID=A0A1E5BC59_9VIBR|nr:chemotaxis protein CheW [Vibrio genomosp. F10]OEE31959.1 chemotaxis protein CheW [Vibrio genomosp. F10 str. ZF-129]OEE93937.1 chemotaxis protein CheW [Vibrio genomosp. F10 str. 9ZC157]
MISSEQALDDYFTAMLDGEDTETLEPAMPEAKTALLESEPEPELEPEPQPEAQTEKRFYKLHDDDIAVPNLEDVERLLQQLESSNPVAELDLDEILEQNTRQIAAEKEAKAEREVQDWTVVEEPVVDDVLIDETVSLQVEETAFVEPVIEAPIVEEPVHQVQEIVDQHVDIETDIAVEQANESPAKVWQSTKRTEDFQVLYFDVNGVMFAVPLDELGGIHRLGTLSHLIGRPGWYLGLQTSKENQLDVVDTAEWVMSEKLSDDSHKDHYQYIVMLGESMWGLASTELKGTESLNTDKVRWREMAGKRPWLAGMVKEKMCALIHVEELIAMLNAGLDVKALDK